MDCPHCGHRMMVNTIHYKDGDSESYYYCDCGAEYE